MKGGKPEGAGDYGKEAVAKALFGKTRRRFRGAHETHRLSGKRVNSTNVRKDNARGAAIYKEDVGELVYECFTESAQPTLYRIHAAPEGTFTVWKCDNNSQGFEMTEDKFDNEYNAMVYVKNLMTAEHNRNVQ